MRTKLRLGLVRGSNGVLVVALLALCLAGCGGTDEKGADGGGGGEGGGLLVLGAASLTTAVTEYAEAFADESGAEVRTSFAGSDGLATQIRQGAATDVFASADTEYPAQLHREGLVEEPVVFASNRLVIAVQADSTIGSLSDLAGPGIKLVIGDESVPVGAYARTVLEQLPAAEREGILANVRSEEPDVGSVIAKLVQGVADAAIVYNTDVAAASAATDVAAAGGDLQAIPLPDELQPGIAYAVAAVSASDSPELAAEFIEGLIEGKGAAALRSAGFLPPP